MEDIKDDVDTTEDTDTTDTTTETSDTVDTDTDESTENIDYKGELEKLEQKKPERTEAEKAARALHFNAARAKELGLDPAEILGVKPKKKAEPDDIDAKVERKFQERDALALCESEDEYKLTMWYVDNHNLGVQEAHLLANKGKIKRSVEEARRGNVQFGNAVSTTKQVQEIVPERSPEEQALLTRRGLSYNPKTKTWQGRFTEEYYDKDTQTWQSRKLKR